MSEKDIPAKDNREKYDSKNIYSGCSWTPEKCIDCGAVYFFGDWCYADDDPRNDE